MPPKQAVKANVVEETTFNDGTGVIKNIVNFKFFYDITYINEIENCNILFEWLIEDGTKKTFDLGPSENFEKTDSEPMEQLEKEPSREQDAENTEEPQIPQKISATAEQYIDRIKIDKNWVKSLCENQ